MFVDVLWRHSSRRSADIEEVVCHVDELVEQFNNQISISASHLRSNYTSNPFFSISPFLFSFIISSLPCFVSIPFSIHFSFSVLFHLLFPFISHLHFSAFCSFCFPFPKKTFCFSSCPRVPPSCFLINDLFQDEMSPEHSNALARSGFGSFGSRLA